MPVTEAVRNYILVPAMSMSQDRLREFATAVGRPPGWTLDAWWRRAAPDCAVAGVERQTGVMAGICCARPSEWVIEGRRHPAIGICTWYVAPEHRGKLSGRSLLRPFDRADRFTYAFSVSRDSIAAFHRLGWTAPAPSSLVALPLPGAARALHRILGWPGGIEIEEFEAGSEVPEALAAHLDKIQSARLGEETAHMCRGAAEWRWRLSVTSGRKYLFAVALRAGKPQGYIAVRRLDRGIALIADLVAAGQARDVLRALILKGAEYAARLRAPALVSAATTPLELSALGRIGFVSWFVGRRAPKFVWLPQGPGARLSDYALTAADSDLDLSL